MNMVVKTYHIEEGDFTLDLSANAYVVSVNGAKTKAGRPYIIVYRPRGFESRSELSPRRFRSLVVDDYMPTDMHCSSPSNVFRVVGTYTDINKKHNVLFEECRFDSPLSGMPPNQYASLEMVESDESLVRNTL